MGLFVLCALFDLLLEIAKQITVKEIVYSYLQAVADLLYSGYGRTVISSADYIIKRRLSHTRKNSELVVGYISFVT